MDADVSAQDVCSGRGVCSAFDRQDVTNPLFFCKCDMGWAGPECTIQQKSQTIAWLLSLSLGFCGADQYYLQLTVPFAAKLFGLFTGTMLSAVDMPHIGVTVVLSYWLYDIVNIGSGPVRARDAKVAADLPHWAFATFTIVYFAFIGFVLAICKVYWKIKDKRRRADFETYYGDQVDAGIKVPGKHEAHGYGSGSLL